MDGKTDNMPIFKCYNKHNIELFTNGTDLRRNQQKYQQILEHEFKCRPVLLYDPFRKRPTKSKPLFVLYANRLTCKPRHAAKKVLFDAIELYSNGLRFNHPSMQSLCKEWLAYQYLHDAITRYPAQFRKEIKRLS